MDEAIRDSGDLVPPENQNMKGVCHDCVKAGIPPDQTRICGACLKCDDIHCQRGIPALLNNKENEAVLSEPPFFNIIS